MKYHSALILLICSGCGAFSSDQDAGSDITAIASSSVSNGAAATTSITSGVLAGAKVDVPAGVLPDGAILSLKEATQPDGFAAAIKTAGASKGSSPLKVAAVTKDGVAISTVSSSMAIELPAVTSGALALAGVEKTQANLCILASAHGTSKMYVWRPHLITFSEDKKKVVYKTLLFGVYQLVYCGNETMTNIANVSMAETGIALSTQIVGSWATGCLAVTDASDNDAPPLNVAVYKETYEITADSKFTYTYIEYEDADPDNSAAANASCAGTQVLSTGRAGTYVEGATLDGATNEREFDLTITTDNLTITQAARITSVNSFSSCTFVSGTAMDLLTNSCFDGNSAPGSSGYTIYSRFKYDGTNLYFTDENASTKAGTTDNDRLEGYDTDSKFTK